MQKELLLFQKLAEKLIKAEKQEPIITPNSSQGTL